MLRIDSRRFTFGPGSHSQWRACFAAVAVVVSAAASRQDGGLNLCTDVPSMAHVSFLLDSERTYEIQATLPAGASAGDEVGPRVRPSTQQRGGRCTHPLSDPA